MTAEVPLTTPTELSTASPGEDQPRLSGRRLVVARAVWLGLAGLTVILFAIGVPLRFAELRSVCTDPAEAEAMVVVFTAGDCANEQLTRLGAQAFAEVGLSVDFYGRYTMTIFGLFALGYWLMGGLIFW